MASQEQAKLLTISLPSSYLLTFLGAYCFHGTLSLFCCVKVTECYVFANSQYFNTIIVLWVNIFCEIDTKNVYRKCCLAYRLL